MNVAQLLECWRQRRRESDARRLLALIAESDRRADRAAADSSTSAYPHPHVSRSFLAIERHGPQS